VTIHSISFTTVSIVYCVLLCFQASTKIADVVESTHMVSDEPDALAPHHVPPVAKDLPSSVEDNEYRLDCVENSSDWGVAVNQAAPGSSKCPRVQVIPKKTNSNTPMPQSQRRTIGAIHDGVSAEDGSSLRTGKHTSSLAEETAPPPLDGELGVHKNLLPALCMPSCAISTLLYTSALVLMGAPLWPHAPMRAEQFGLHDSTSYPEPDPAFARICLLCSVALLAAAVHSAIVLIFIPRGAAQRSVSHCAVCINLIGAHAHWMMGAGHSPTYDSCFGRTMHATRFAEWLSSLFLIMVMTNALDCSSRCDLLRESGRHILSIVLGFTASAACQLSGGPSGCSLKNIGIDSNCCNSNNCTDVIVSGSCHGSAAHWQHRGVSGPDDRAWWLPSSIMQASAAHQLNLVLLPLSCWCHVSWLLKVRHEWQERLNAQRAGYNVSLAHATQAAVLRAFAAATWTMLPVLFFLGVSNSSWFPPNIEIRAYSVVDLLTKFMYANVLCNANLLNHWAEDRARAEIIHKEKANEAHRHFLR